MACTTAAELQYRSCSEPGEARQAVLCTGTGAGRREGWSLPQLLWVLPSSQGVASHSLCFSFHSCFPGYAEVKIRCLLHPTHPPCNIYSLPAIHCAISHSSERTTATLGKKSQTVAFPFSHKTRSFHRLLQPFKAQAYLLLKKHKELR